MAAGETTLNTGGDHRDADRVLIHDFLNLLAVIVNYSELIAEETGDPEAVKADIQEVRAAAERAIVLTEKLRGIGKPAPETNPPPARTP